jgi:alkylation response protein AidB-like acyl-CoA dehydrogenase
MSNYKAPVKDILFAARHLADLEGITALPGYEDATPDLLEAILQEAAKIGEEVLAPLNKVGDIQGVSLNNGEVKTPDGWKEAYSTFIEGGWNGLPFNPDRGGQGLPWLVATAVQEIWHSSNMAFSLCSLLTQAAIEAIALHGTENQKADYLTNLIHGNWSGTMNLTESHCGSDLAMIKTQAVLNGDHYLISGQKIYITYGDHDMADNIIHLVLARLPDAPPGIKGISLFIVPKFLRDGNGEWTSRNDVETISLEHKLGIHGSPTAVLGYGTGKYRKQKGAVGYLVGKENQGMTYMFTMMNIARLAVGLEGNGVAERAYQQAAWFAGERIQGTAIDHPRGDRVAIINHPDVKRMLMLQKCRIEGLRSLGLILGGAFDKSLKSEDPETRKIGQSMVDVLTPIVKSYMTELGLENVSIALQVHGGMGFIEETGAAQYYRDQRITSIYEGTNGIQALDLIGRKLLRDQGHISRAVISFIRSDMKNVHQPELKDMKDQVDASLDLLESAITSILAMASEDMRKPAGICDPYLRLWGTICCGWQLARAAAAAITLDDGNDPFYPAKIETARFYFAYEMPKAIYYVSVIQNSARSIAELDISVFDVAT